MVQAGERHGSVTEIPSFGEWLQKRRVQLGLTCKALAQQGGCSPVTIKKIELPHCLVKVGSSKRGWTRLWQSQAKQKEAHPMVGEIYAWFTEDFDTADLQEAEALPRELSSILPSGWTKPNAR